MTSNTIFDKLDNPYDTIKTYDLSYIPTCGDFDESLKVEKLGQPAADDFYKNCLGAIDIKRYDYNNPDQQFLQKQDIDCSIQLHAKALDIFWLNFSEKFRQCETGDMCIELWSDFEKKKLGWAVRSSPNEKGPDYYLYVTPEYFYEVCARRYFNNMIKKITTEWDWKTINTFINKEETRLKRKSYYNGCYNIKIEDHDAKLLKVWSNKGNREWFGVSVCIPWKTLFNDFVIDINVYDRDYNKMNINEM